MQPRFILVDLLFGNPGHRLAGEPGHIPLANPVNRLLNGQLGMPAQLPGGLVRIKRQILRFVNLLAAGNFPPRTARPDLAHAVGHPRNRFRQVGGGAKIPRAGKPSAILKQMLGQGNVSG